MPRFVVIARDPLVADEAAAARLAGIQHERRHASELSLDAVFGQLGSADLFAARSGYHYVDFLDLKLRKAEGERLAGMLERMPEEITLVCSQVLHDMTRTEEERALKSADFQRIAAGAQVDDLRRVSEGAAATRWLAERAGKVHGVKLTGAQAQRVLDAAGGRLALADGELRKLALLAETEGGATVSDVQLGEVLSLSPAVAFWGLADAVMDGRPEAQARLGEWFSLEPETFRLLAELRRRLLGLRALELGEPVMPPFFAKQLAGQRRRWTPARVRAGIEELAETEFRLKSGLIPGSSSKDAELTALQVLTRRLAG